MLERELAVFTPIPPEQNGIADYARHLIAALAPKARLAVYANQPDGILTEGVPIREPLQAFRHLRPGDPILHQIGNNPGHIFVLQALRTWGGVTTLHDQNLHYLYEVSNAPQTLLARNMSASSPRLGAVFARQWFEDGVKTMSNYVLFDMLNEVLSLSDAVIVHSRFAKNRIRLLYGEAAASRVHVIPHLALPPDDATDDYLHGTLRVPTGVPLIVSSGFATFAKRFDWLVAALDELARRGVEFFWVHAGKERPEEYDLSGLLDRYPAVKARSRITGYLTEEQLNECIAKCDVLVNLRFPSVGESSGTLARAMAAGRCCIVNATAAYAEMPADAVMHMPVTGTVPALAQGLARLIADPELRAGFGAKARELALGAWSPGAVAQAYLEVMARESGKAEARGKRRQDGAGRLTFDIGAATLKDKIAEGTHDLYGDVEILLAASSPEQMARISLKRETLLTEMLPQNLHVRTVTVVPAAARRGKAGVALMLKGTLE